MNPDFSNLQGKRKLVREIGEIEKSGVKLQSSTEESERLLVRVIGRFKKNEGSKNRGSTVVHIKTVWSGTDSLDKHNKMADIYFRYKLLNAVAFPELIVADISVVNSRGHFYHSENSQMSANVLDACHKI